MPRREAHSLRPLGGRNRGIPVDRAAPTNSLWGEGVERGGEQEQRARLRLTLLYIVFLRVEQLETQQPVTGADAAVAYSFQGQVDAFGLESIYCCQDCVAAV